VLASFFEGRAECPRTADKMSALRLVDNLGRIQNAVKLVLVFREIVSAR
jgi:hypothetical protein